ncbi:MAG: hypothetical protein SGJ27_04785 [Candidatus Melainabacteria bacterium]|nr:hypothetical protein [Candidatus Melainabacteria bacterium]
MVGDITVLVLGGALTVELEADDFTTAGLFGGGVSAVPDSAATEGLIPKNDRQLDSATKVDTIAMEKCRKQFSNLPATGELC